MRLRFIWLGISLFLSSGLMALATMWLVGEGYSIFGVAFGLNIIQDLFVFAGGGSFAFGIMSKPKSKVG